MGLDDIAAILAACDNGLAPCRRVLDTIAGQLDEIDHCIADLLMLRDVLKRLHREGATYCLRKLMLPSRPDSGGLKSYSGNQFRYFSIGMVTDSLVPWPGAVLIESVPPTAHTRS